MLPFVTERGLELVDDFVDDKRFSLSRKHIRISAGSSTLTKRDAGWDDGHGAALSATPLSLLKRRGNSFHTHNNETSDMHLRFPLDAVQCSPIPDIPEEEGYSSSKSDDFPGTSSGLHLSTSSGGSSARPLPDMNAFEEDHANNMSRSSLSSTRSGGDVPPSPKLHCPPTPVRIHPIFRTNLGPKMSRSNSLIANKLLATCSTQGFGARVSLEHPSENAVDVGPVENIDKEKQITACDIDPICHEPEDWLHNSRTFSSTQKVKRCDVKSHVTNFSENVVSMSSSFDVISFLGSGAFADVYKVKSKVGGQLYAVKRNRQQFRSRRDRERVLLEVRSMQRLQSQANLITQRSGETTIDYSLYLLVFYQAWQEDGHFFCQTELCCRDTCREMLDATRSQWNVAKTKYPCLRRLPAPNGVVAGSALDIEGRLLPEPVIWKICHDIASGLSFIHSKHVGLVHNDLKPSNMFFVKHVHFGATCKIGDFGMARSVDSLEDGQEGDQKYMSLEMLETGKSLPKSDIFSLGLALYEMASMLNFVLPSDGYRWHELRNGKHKLEFPRDRSVELSALVCLMIDPDPGKRPTADEILLIRNVADAGKAHCEFLGLYVHEVEVCQQLDEEKDEDQNDEQTPRIAPRTLRSPPFTKQLPNPPLSMHSPTVTLS